MEWWQILLISLGSVIFLIFLSTVLYRQFFKRFYDVLLSGIAIIILLPILIILIIVGYISMRGNPFFFQLRPGMIDKKTGKSKIFKLIKFRSMTNKKDEDGKLLPDKERLTKYGKILRATSLDELPELFNIFLGHMSIVGPRPLLPTYLEYYTDEEQHRHDVRPGLTGLAQVNGRNAISWDDKLAYDVKYVKNLSLALDIKIIFKTVIKVLQRSGISAKKDPNRKSFIEQRKLRMQEQQNCQEEIDNKSN